MASADSKPKVKIQVHDLTDEPLECWEATKHLQKIHEKVEPLPLDTPIYPDKVRFVVISDTHNKSSSIQMPPAGGDVMLCCGDITMEGDPTEALNFYRILGQLQPKIPIKILIAGNHDLTFDPKFWWPRIGWQTVGQRWGLDMNACHEHVRSLFGCESMKELMEREGTFIYLEDAATEVYGIKIYGSPWQPEFGWWAFNDRRGDRMLWKWDKIPDDTEILMTHGPPLGFCDETVSKDRAGCKELLSTIQERVKPKYHCFGHIHEGYGIMTDGTTTYINASNVTRRYDPINPAIIFDYPLPPGKTKEEYVAEKKEKDKTRHEEWVKIRAERWKRWEEEKKEGTYKCWTH